MRKKSFIYAVALVISMVQSGFSQTENLNDFRETKWGMNKNQVLGLELSDLKVDNPNLLTYEGTVAGYDAYIDYIFTGKRLYDAGYKILIKHENHDEYIEDYKKLKSLLTEKYGPSTGKLDETSGEYDDEEVWLFDQYKSDPNLRGKAMARGHLKFHSEWRTKNTKVTLTLKGKEYVVSLDISYETLNKKKDKSTFERKQRTYGL